MPGRGGNVIKRNYKQSKVPIRAIVPDTDLPDPPQVPEGAPLSHYKGTSLKNVGRDLKTGKSIPHKRSELVAAKIAKWVAGGYTINDIAVHLNIRPGLIRQEYGREINHGAEVVGMEMTESIVDRAKKSDALAIFYARARMGWKGDGEASSPSLPLAPVNVQVVFVSPQNHA